MKKRISFFAALEIVFFLLINVGNPCWAATPLQVCTAGMGTEEPSNVTIFELGSDEKIIVGNIVVAGFICLIKKSEGEFILLDRKTGLDVVGTIQDAAIIRGSSVPFLKTSQIFRGGSNYNRDYYVIYSLYNKQIRESLQIPKFKRLTINDRDFRNSYQFNEVNKLSFQDTTLNIMQILSINALTNDKEQKIYESRRNYTLRYSEKFAYFLEGEAICKEIMNIDNKICKQSGEHVGYLFDPGIADASGLRIVLINENGDEVLLKDLNKIMFLDFIKVKQGG